MTIAMFEHCTSLLVDLPRRVAVPLLALLLTGCSTLDYYGQLARGQLQLLSARQPVQALIDDPATEPELRQRLVLSLSLIHI